MSIQSRHRNGLSITALILLVLGFSSVSAGQETPPKDADPNVDNTPEEIVVYGKPTIIVLQNELYKAEKKFFTVFNSLNSHRDFNVHCKKRQASISQRRRIHTCTPHFADREAAMASSSFLIGGFSGSAGANAQYAARVKEKNDQMFAEMADLVMEHPELMREMVNLQKANYALNIERQKRSKD